MYQYFFDFQGGLKKQGGVTSKFYLFSLIPKEGKKNMGVEEVIMYEAKKKAIIVNNALVQLSSEDRENTFGYAVSVPYLKVFTLVEGFGLTGSHHYFSFFFKLSHEGRIVTIKPLSAVRNAQETMYFKGRGQFLTPEEVKNLLGEKSVSFGYYKRQCPLPRTILQQIVTTEIDMSTLPPSTKEIRRVRL